ncbi:hypothetical protein LXL04_019362 [Taraxacum kok-saghyz]
MRIPRHQMLMSHLVLLQLFDLLRVSQVTKEGKYTQSDVPQQLQHLVLASLSFAYEEVSEISIGHRFIAYTIYDKDTDFFELCIRDLNLGSLCSKPQVDWVCNVAWAKGGQALVYVVTNQNKKPYGIYCSMLGTKDEDVILLEEPAQNIHVNIRHTKDYKFVTVNVFSTTYSKVFLINTADPLSGLTLIWECEPCAHCIIEHHQGYLYLFTNADRNGQSVNYHYILRSRLHSCNSKKVGECVS